MSGRAVFRGHDISWDPTKRRGHDLRQAFRSTGQALVSWQISRFSVKERRGIGPA